MNYTTVGEGSPEPHPDSPKGREEYNAYVEKLKISTEPETRASTSHADFHEQEVEVMQQILDSISRLENRTDAFLDQHYAEPTDPGHEEKGMYASRWEECHAIRMELLNRIGAYVEQITRRFRA